MLNSLNLGFQNPENAKKKTPERKLIRTPFFMSSHDDRNTTTTLIQLYTRSLYRTKFFRLNGFFKTLKFSFRDD